MTEEPIEPEELEEEEAPATHVPDQSRYGPRGTTDSPRYSSMTGLPLRPKPEK